MTRKAKKIFCVFGTRPEAIKMAPVVLALKSRLAEFECRVVATAQHRGLLDQVLSLFNIRADYDLNTMREGQSLTGVTTRILEKLEPVLRKEAPDLALVHGDTTTAMAAALACFYQKIPVGHVEAGLRSFDYGNPYPEELNRRWVDAASALHFSPTENSRRNLLREGISSRNVFVTGNSGIDAMRLAVRSARAGGAFKPSRTAARFLRTPFILVTAHRRENFGRPLEDLCEGLKEAASRRRDVHFVYPVHPNPNVGPLVQKRLGGVPNIHLLPPVGYADMAHLLLRCRFVVTDSGGIQEEAPSLGKPVLVARKITERPEAVKAGTVKIIGTEPGTVSSWILRLLEDGACRRRMARAVNPYGDGRAAPRILSALRFYFGFTSRRPSPFRPS